MSEVKILVVEDHKPTRKTFSLLAEKHQFKIVGETSLTKEALLMVKNEKPDVIILDLVLPEQSVLDFISEVKAHFSPLPIIACSSLKEAHVVNQVLEAGCFDYILKPFNEERFTQAIRKAVA